MEINLITPFDNDKLKCDRDKCCLIPEITIFNSENRVKVFSECQNKHFNISLLDEYIKNNISYNSNNISKCEKCKKEKKLKYVNFAIIIYVKNAIIII